MKKGEDPVKVYRVDVRNLPPAERAALREQLGQWAHMCTAAFDSSNQMVTLDVYWTSKEDFQSSYALPPGCSCSLISG